MNEPQADTIPPLPDNSAPMPLSARLLNVFVSPGEVFDAVKASQFAASNWAVPAVALVVISWVCSFLIFSQPAIEQQIRELASRAIEQQVASGKMPRQQAGQVQAVAEKWGVLGAKIAAYVSPPFIAVVAAFGWGLVVWLIGTKVFKADFGYLKAVEVSGLAAMISTLDALVRSLLILITGNLFAAISPALLVQNFDAQNPVHQVIALFNLLAIWALAVRATGLARLTGKGFGKSAAWIFGLWLGYNALAIGGAALMTFVFARPHP